MKKACLTTKYTLTASCTKMKLLLPFLLALVASVGSFAQTSNTTYFDANWKETTKDKASFYSVDTQNGNGTLTSKDYYISGQLQMSGQFKSAAKQVRDGYFTYFFENGKTSSEGLFKNDRRAENWTWYHDNGTIKEKGEYDRKGLKTGTWRGWYADGSADFEGVFQKDLREGIWKWHHANGQVSARETYTKGQATKTEFYNEIGADCRASNCGASQPSFKGGEQALFAYLKQELKYPKEAAEAQVEGTVWVRFRVLNTGKLDNIHITKGVHWALNKEAIRVIKGMPKWVPGKKHNRATAYDIELPFNFKASE